MATYTLKTGKEKLSVGFKRMKAGEEFELNERQAETFKNMIEPVSASKKKSRSKDK